MARELPTSATSKSSPELREQAVQLVKASGKTVARDQNINDTTLGNWVKPTAPNAPS